MMMNENVKPLYMHKKKSRVISAHNRITVEDQTYFVERDYVLIDLDD
jgi:hypothetical protein